MDNTYLGIGFYTLSEAERLIGVPTYSIRRWISGYNYSRKGKRCHSNPVWGAEKIYQRSIMNITFADLVEIMFVRAFRKHGVPWTEIRAAADYAAREFNYSRPFSTLKFKTDGKRILSDYAEKENLQCLYEITKNNFAMRPILEPFMKHELEFENEIVSRWYPPQAPNRSVVLDSQRGFGKPIIDQFGVPTEVLAASYTAEKSFARAADWYEVSPEAVKAAVKFERAIHA